MGDTCRNCRGEKTEIVYPGGLAMAVPCRACNGTGHIPAPKPDPRDARIAELEGALAGLAVAAVDAASFDVCHEDQCPRLSTWWRVAVGNAAWESCDEHIEGFRAEDAKAESKGCRKREGWREREEAAEVRAFGAAIEDAERALGRRK